MKKSQINSKPMLPVNSLPFDELSAEEVIARVNTHFEEIASTDPNLDDITRGTNQVLLQAKRLAEKELKEASDE